MNKKLFILECSKLNIVIDEEIYKKLEMYHTLLCEWNKKFNLTTILEKEQVFLKHFYDSLCLIKSVNLNNKLKLCDIGTGAGFPGIVLKIVFTELDVTLVESNKKKCQFLQVVIDELKLENVNVINMRAEEFALKNKEKFDVVTTRAVASMRIISEISLPMVKIGGVFVPLKSHVDEEMKETYSIMKILGGKLEEIIEYKLPVELSKRTIPLIKKETSSKDGYPRTYSQIIKYIK